jgi:hypothetical protein
VKLCGSEALELFFLSWSPAKHCTGPVQSGTAQNRLNSNFKSKSVVQSVWSGIPTGLIGIPVRFDRLLVVETKKKPNQWRI